MKIITLLLRICLLTMESLPDCMMAAAAKVGNSAHHPGYRLFSLRKNEAIIISISPIIDNALPSYFSILIFLKANSPPIDICQNLQNGK